MKIPREFQRELFMFISSELNQNTHPPTPVELAELCGGFCRRWFGVMESTVIGHQSRMTELVAWAERLGKHVGDFFLNHKEG